MKTLHIKVKRNNLVLFKKIDIPAKLESATIHMEASPRNCTLWDYSFKIYKNPKNDKKYEMMLTVYFLEENEIEPAENIIKSTIRKLKIKGISNPDVDYIIDNKLKKLIKED